MTRFKILARLGAFALCLLLISCGGGSTGASASSGGSWLTFSPASVSLEVLPSTRTPFSVTATSTRKFAEIVNVGIIDTRGVILPTASVVALSSLRYVASMETNHALPPGTYEGSFEVRVCYDNPITCARPVDGSPWQLPYRIVIRDSSTLSFSAWEAASTTPGFLDDFALSNIGTTPFVVTAGFYTKVMETWSSSDLGTTWVNTGANSVTPLTKGFALATDGSSMYLSGGEELSTMTTSVPPDQYRNHVWKFDGTTWTQQTASAAFTARSQHTMAKVGSTLYLIGGRRMSSLLYDVWKSSDDGVTWTKVIDAVPSAIGWPTCALNWNGNLLIAGDRVATSADGGATWTVHAAYSAATSRGPVQCAILNNRLVVNYVDDGYSTFSTADLSTWRLEPRPGLVSPVPGMAEIGGRLIMTTGSGSSQRTTYRTVP